METLKVGMKVRLSAKYIAKSNLSTYADTSTVFEIRALHGSYLSIGNNKITTGVGNRDYGELIIVPSIKETLAHFRYRLSLARFTKTNVFKDTSHGL